MKKLLSLTLGVLTAFGAFIDIGDLVTDALVGSRYGLNMVWVTVIAVIGIATYAEMAGRVAIVTDRPVFDLVRERLGARAALLNLLASYGVTAILVIAEICGVALAIELATSVNYLLWVPIVAFLLFLFVWRVPFKVMERTYGLLGLAMVVYMVGVWQLGPDWGDLWHRVTHPGIPPGEAAPTYFFYAIALLGAQMTPYEVFFFSSGAIEHRWTPDDLREARLNVFIGFPLGGLTAIAIQAIAAYVLAPRGIVADSLALTALPVAVAVGKLGLAIAILGFVACTFGAAIETLMSSTYTVAQYFGWEWGKYEPRIEAARFNTLMLGTLIAATMVALTTIDPITVTVYGVFLGAATLPLTYVPILTVANDQRMMGEYANGRLANSIATVYVVILTVVSLASIPLLVLTTEG